jgi:predicted O-methyltransferase YrrM
LRARPDDRSMGRYPQLIDSSVLDYILKNSVREPALLARLREETANHPDAQFQIPPEQGQLMQLLIKMTGARRTIEVGVFTGYSSLAVALALPADGKVIACDVSEEYTAIARRYWAEAGVTEKIDLRIAPAAETLNRMIEAGESGRYDFAFIDADKAAYPGYYEQCLQLLRPGGVVALDNMLQMGQVAEEPIPAGSATVIHELNQLIHGDQRVDAFLLPFSDGLTIAVKR